MLTAHSVGTIWRASDRVRLGLLVLPHSNGVVGKNVNPFEIHESGTAAMYALESICVSFVYHST
jgi:hypothetical protein